MTYVDSSPFRAGTCREVRCRRYEHDLRRLLSDEAGLLSRTARPIRVVKENEHIGRAKEGKETTPKILHMLKLTKEKARLTL